MLRSIRAQVEATVLQHVGDAIAKKHFQGANVAARRGILDYLKAVFQTSSAVTAQFFPWRLPTQYDGQNVNVQHFRFGSMAVTAPNVSYQEKSWNLATEDYARARLSGTPWTFAKTDYREIIGSINTSRGAAFAPGVITASDMAVRSVGNTWFHPCMTGTANIAIGGIGGSSYLTTIAITGAGGGTWYGPALPIPNGNSYVRITSGVDAGLYRVRYWDNVNSRVYLDNLDGTHFVAAGGAQTGVSINIAYRISTFFNETGVVPISAGAASTVFGGNFDPGNNRASYLFRIHIEKTGSPSPSGGAHLTGSYWFNVRPYIMGEGTGTNASHAENGGLTTSVTGILATGIGGGAMSAGFVGGCPGLAFDATNQRLWGCSDNGTNGDIFWWLYKTPECLHEVATSTGTPNDPLAGITITGLRPRALEMDTDGNVYVALGGGAGANVTKITPALAVSSLTMAGAGLGNLLNGLKIDKTRARSTAAGTVSTAAAGNTVTVTGGAFTQADVGRAITLAGGSADNGTYKIATYVGATQVTVQTMAGGAVSFTGTTNSGSMKIGDRIYLFFNDTTSNAGSGAGFISLRYVESLDFTTVLTTGDLAVTNSTGRTLYDGHASCRGMKPVAEIDPGTGNLYWASSDTAARLNRYNVTARTVSQKTVASFAEPADGSAITDPTLIYAIGINPHASFREVWLGTDQGWVRFSPDHADLSTLTTGAYAYALASNQYRRYHGDGVTSAYTSPANYTRPDGSLGAARTMGTTFFGADGKVFGVEHVGGGNLTRYNRELDHWSYAGWLGGTSNLNPSSTGATFVLVNAYHEFIVCTPASTIPFAVGGIPTDYQWIAAAWAPKEVVRGVIPDATSQPGGLAKPLHTTADALLFGVTLAFGTGAGTDADQFIGRMSQKQAMQSDGAWAAGTTSNWKGSNFTAADVGRILRVETRAQAGIYLITGYVNSTTLTVQTLARAAYNASADAVATDYTIWDLGATDRGAEVATCVAANGLFADNTQDITNINTEFFTTKTLLSEQVEAIKVAHGVVPVPGSASTVLNHDAYAISTNQPLPAIPSGLALTGTAPSNATVEELLNYGAGRTIMDGSLGHGTANVPGATVGVGANNALSGAATALDFGADVEIGAVIVRMRVGSTGTCVLLGTETANVGGMLGNLHRALSAGGAPVASVSPTHARSGVSGANGLGLPAASPPVATLTSGNYLGAASVTYTDGVTVQGGNTLASALGRFTGLTGSVVQLTSGSDVGYYRITAVSGDGATATVRKLGQTVVTWLASSAGLSFAIYANAAREDDILYCSASGFRSTVEMLVSPTVARVRSYHTGALTNVAWEILAPTWTLVKRLEHSVMATPPNVANNKTYVTSDGLDDKVTQLAAVKAVFDLSDLTTAQRTGRYWKFSYCGRYTSSGTTPACLLSIEFYDTSGKRLLASPTGYVDTVDSQPDFLACHITRLDWIQALYAASALVPGVNALATIGGTGGSTVTLAGAAPFLPLRIALGSTITAVGGDAFFDITGSDRAFVTSDAGRIIWVQAGPNTGYYRILTIPSGTRISVSAVDGTASILAADATPRAWSIHEGILAGAGSYDYINLGSYGEFTILSVSADLTTITLNEATGYSASGLTWEIRRRATVSTSTAADGTKVARLLYSSASGPFQPGDVVQDHKGALGFWPPDVNAFGVVARADGATTIGTAGFTGSGFSPDDVGRMLVITGGADIGPYRIATYVNSTSITVVNIRTGAAVSFAASAATLGYKVVGERRFRISRYATMLRQ